MKNREQSAFPLPIKHEQHESFDGLTKREYFAAMAMQGLIAGADTKVNLEELGKQSVLCADYVLSALEKKI